MTRLCVPILVEGLAGVADALEAAEHGAAFGADLVEWRIDPLAAEPDHRGAAAAVVRLVRDAPRPVILTCRDAEEGGAAEIDDEDRAALLEAVADRDPAHRPRYVDLELASWQRSPRLRDAVRRVLGRPPGEPGEPAASTEHDGSRLILSSHAFEGRPSDLWARVATMASIEEVDVIKVAWTARSLRDVAEAAELLAERPRPMIALTMGPFGLASRVLAGRFGGLLTFATLGEETATAPGQPTLAVMRDLYRIRDVGASTRVYGVIGMPVDHSVGPRLHNAAFAAAGVDAVYLPMPVEAGWESFKATLAVVLDTPAFGFAGASVTIPHKEHALRYVQEQDGEVDPLAALSGAANTIIVRDDGRLAAVNTDIPALRHALEPAVERAGLRLEGARVLVLGAGGAAAAAATGLAGAGARVMIAGRTPSRVDALRDRLHGQPRPSHAGTLQVAAVALDSVSADDVDVVVNATPVGMATGPDADGDPLPDAVALGPRHVVLDTVYAPIETPLVQRARTARSHVVTGDEMFERQAEAQFTAWTSLEMPGVAWDAIRRPGDAAT